MLEFFKFALSSFWIFIGVMCLISVIGYTICMIIQSIRNPSSKNILTYTKTYEFDGIISGDFDAFCWDVSKPTFKEITGREPEEHEISFFNGNYVYRIYPVDLFNKYTKEKQIQKFKIGIK